MRTDFSKASEELRCFEPSIKTEKPKIRKIKKATFVATMFPANNTNGHGDNHINSSI